MGEKLATLAAELSWHHYCKYQLRTFILSPTDSF